MRYMTNLQPARWELKKLVRCGGFHKIFFASSLNQVVLMIHCGSRGFGHQVATDALVSMEKAMKRDDIEVGGISIFTKNSVHR